GTGEVFVELRPAVVPGRKTSTGAGAKQMIARGLRHLLDDLERWRRERDLERIAVLAALGGQRPCASLEVEFGPAHAADLLAPRAEQDQQADDVTEVIFAADAPYGD